jgi:hypothetical protein
MDSLNEPKSPDSQSERSDASLGKLIDRSHQAIVQSRARIARSRALSRSEADLARAIDQIDKQSADASGEE